MKNKIFGFTLIELLISTMIMSILIGIANVSYAAIRSYWSAEETRAALYSGFITAKTQAMASGQNTVICPSTDGAQCSARPIWQHGWIIFQDENKNREIDAEDTPLLIQKALSSGITLSSNQGRPRLVFQANGSNGGTNATFILCDSRGPSKAKSLIISNNSRIRTAPADSIAAEQTCI